LKPLEENTMTEIDYQTRIDAENGRVVFVDKFDDDAVWLSIQVNGGNANTTMTFDQAKQMIAALTRIVEGA
jgi:hypothetical protein